jgi:hypothetical protein
MTTELRTARPGLEEMRDQFARDGFLLVPGVLGFWGSISRT